MRLTSREPDGAIGALIGGVARVAGGCWPNSTRRIHCAQVNSSVRQRGVSTDRAPGDKVSRERSLPWERALSQSGEVRQESGASPSLPGSAAQPVPDALEPRAEGIHSQGRWRIREEVPPQLRAGELLR